MSNRKSMTVADDDAGGSGSGSSGRKITGVSCHVRGGAGVHEPVTDTTVRGRRGSGLKSGQKGGVPLGRARGRGVVGGRSRGRSVAGRGGGLGRRGVESLVQGRARPHGARVWGARHGHGVGVDDPGPGVMAGDPWWRGGDLLRWTGRGSGVTGVATAVAATVATSTTASSVATTVAAAVGRR